MKWSLASLSLSMLLSSLGTSIANVALPTLTEAFGVSFQAVQWIVLAYLLAVTTLIVAIGRLGDTIGRRRLLLTGIVLFTAASAAGGSASTLWQLIMARAVQGLGAAAMMSLTMAFVGEMIPQEKTGQAMGLLGTMSAVGTALGPSLGGFLIWEFGWRAIFLVTLPLGSLAFLLASRQLPRDRPRVDGERAGFDYPGMVLLAVSLAAYSLAMTIGRGRFSEINAGLLLASTVGIGLFVRIEKTAKAPLVRLTMFVDPVFRSGLVASMLVATVMMVTLVVGPFYLSRALALDAASVGLIVSVGPIVVAIAGLPAGRIADRFGAQVMSRIGLAAIAAGCFILSVSPISLGVVGYIGPLVVVTAGYALFQTANNTVVMKNISAERRGVVSSLLNLSRNLGLITGASMMGTVFTLASGTADVSTASAEAVAGGMRITFAVASALIVLALAAGQSRKTEILPAT